MISASIDVESMYPTVEPANISNAVTISIFLWLVVDSLPDISTNGMISRFGSIVSNCFSNALVFGKMRDNVSSIGVTARPGRFTISESDNMAIYAIGSNGSLPVLIGFISYGFYSCQAQDPEASLPGLCLVCK